MSRWADWACIFFQSIIAVELVQYYYYCFALDKHTAPAPELSIMSGCKYVVVIVGSNTTILLLNVGEGLENQNTVVYLHIIFSYSVVVYDGHGQTKGGKSWFN